VAARGLVRSCRTPRAWRRMVLSVARRRPVATAILPAVIALAPSVVALCGGAIIAVMVQPDGARWFLRARAGWSAAVWLGVRGALAGVGSSGDGADRVRVAAEAGEPELRCRRQLVEGIDCRSRSGRRSAG